MSGARGATGPGGDGEILEPAFMRLRAPRRDRVASDEMGAEPFERADGLS